MRHVNVLPDVRQHPPGRGGPQLPPLLLLNLPLRPQHRQEDRQSDVSEAQRGAIFYCTEIGNIWENIVATSQFQYASLDYVNFI